MAYQIKKSKKEGIKFENPPVGFYPVLKDYKDEIWETKPIEYQGKKILATVYMAYHTFLKYWQVTYKLGYGKDFRYGMPPVKTIHHLHSRKEAREIAFKYMKEAKPVKDLDKVTDSEFYKKRIIEEGEDWK
jgi:hypothetical protein